MSKTRWLQQQVFFTNPMRRWAIECVLPVRRAGVRLWCTRLGPVPTTHKIAVLWAIESLPSLLSQPLFLLKKDGGVCQMLVILPRLRHPCDVEKKRLKLQKSAKGCPCNSSRFTLFKQDKNFFISYTTATEQDHASNWTAVRQRHTSLHMISVPHLIYTCPELNISHLNCTKIQNRFWQSSHNCSNPGRDVPILNHG